MSLASLSKGQTKFSINLPFSVFYIASFHISPQVPNQRRQRQVVAHRKEEIAKLKFIEAQKLVEQQRIADREKYEASFAARVEAGRRKLWIKVNMVLKLKTC